MRFLRRISTRRLLALCAAVLAIAIGSAAGAMAMAGAGPKPAPESLPVAVHNALSAPSVPGISARVQFTNHLLDAASIEGQGSDPFLSGASGRLWAAADGRLRLELQSEGGGGDSQVLVDEGRFEIYDGASSTVYRGDLPEASGGAGGPGGGHQPPSLEQVDEATSRLGAHATLSGATPSDVAGRPTYTVRIEPKSNGGLLGGAEIAWDAVHGTPLRAALYAKGDSSPVIELEATEVSFESVPTSVFEITPPPGTKVVELSPPSGSSGGGSGAGSGPPTGAAAVQGQLSFNLSAPASLAGMAQGEVRSIRVGKKTGALLTYGKGLGGIAVLESPSGSGGGTGASEPGASGTEAGGLSLPTVSIDGTKSQELETALGTVLRFSRGGVDYVVAGSVPPATAEAAARGL
jgi:outer membrane lipoprotein-sorting protein